MAPRVQSCWLCLWSPPRLWSPLSVFHHFAPCLYPKSSVFSSSSTTLYLLKVCCSLEGLHSFSLAAHYASNCLPPTCQQCHLPFLLPITPRHTFSKKRLAGRKRPKLGSNLSDCIFTPLPSPSFPPSADYLCQILWLYAPQRRDLSCTCTSTKKKKSSLWNSMAAFAFL